MAITTTADLDIRTHQLEILQTSRAASAFAQAMGVRDIPVGERTSVFTIDTIAPQWVAEGASKPAGSGGTALTVLAQKAAYIHVVTNEVDDIVGNLATAIGSKMPGYYAKLFDATLSGQTATPNAQFHTFSSAPEVEVSNWTDLNDVLGEVERPASAFVLSEKLYRKLTGLVTSTGAPILPEGSTSLLGLPVYRYHSTEANGFVGDFEGASFAGFNIDPTARRSTESTITDSDNVTHNLFQENKVAYLFEGFMASGIYDVTNNFRKLVWEDENDTGGGVEG